MKTITRFFKAAVLVIAAAITLACTGGKQPSTEFSAYIKAYTGGVISSNSTIKVEFATSLGAEQSAEGLLSFTPAIKGQARWTSNTLLEFIPEEGELTPGKTYDASLRLDKIADVSADLKKFEFSFAVEPKQIALDIDYYRITADDPSVAAVYGNIKFSSDMPADKVASTLRVEYGNEQGAIQVSQGTEPNSYNFIVNGCKRSSYAVPFTIWVDAKKYGYSKETGLGVDIPATEGFTKVVYSCANVAEPYIDVVFNQPLDQDQNPDGLFTLSNVGRYYFQKDGNRMRIYYEPLGNGNVGINISGDVRSIDGQKLGEDESYTLKSDEPVPAVSIKLDGTILPDPSQLILPFEAQNLNAVDIRIVKIYESNVLTYLQENNLSGTSEMRRSGRLVYKNTLRLDADQSVNLHRKNLFCVDLSGIMRKEPGAIYIVRLCFNKEYSLYGKGSASSAASTGEMITLSADGGITEEDEAIWDTPYSYYYDDFYDWREYNWNESDDPTKASFYMDSYKFPQISLMASNLGLIAKYADSGKIWVTANDIVTTDPVKGAEINVYNFQLQKIGGGKTDINGCAEIEVSGKPWAVTARNGKTMAYLKVEDGYENSLSRFDTGGKKVSKGLKGYVYGERGVWRPGDELFLTLVLEDREDRLPAGHPVTMEVYTPQGQFYDKQVSTNGVNGFYSFKLETADDDPTGTWNAYFKVGGATFHKALHIETIKPNRLKVKLDVSGSALSSGSGSNFMVSSNWLTGPAASNLKTSVEMTLAKSSTSFKGYEGYTFTNPAADYSPNTYTIFEKVLDGNGKVASTVTMPKVSNAPGMLKANIVTRVFEQGGDASITTTSMPFSPYSAYVGIKAPESGDTWLETDKDQVFQIAVVDKDGKTVSGHKLEYRIYKINWSWWWENDEDLGSYVNSRYAETIKKDKITATDGKASIDFRIEYPEWGRYLVYVKDLNSGHATGCTVMIDWPSWRGRSDKSDPSAATMLSFSTDKTSYKVGEEATVYIPAAATGRALVSLENGTGVIYRSWVSTSDKDTKYSFKVTEEMAPNFYINITLLQPHKQSVNDSPIRMYGVQSVLVTNEASHLNPEITVPEVIRPLEEFTVKVKEKNNKAMTYTLAIVDEGLLDLTNFKTPDPWKEMYSKEALAVRTWDLYNEVVGAFGSKLNPIFSVGGDEDMSKDKVQENRFNPVVKFYGPFTLKSGSATHKITLPMYVGSVRVMVVAGKDEAYGCAEKAVPVRNPLMILPTLPRVMGCGEDVTLPVNVFAMEEGVKDVTVSVKCEGPLKVAGSSQQELTFSTTGDKLVRFNLKATDEEGIAKVTIVATGAGRKAEETINIAVRNPNPVTTQVTRKAIAAGKTETFEWNRAITADLELAGFPTMDLNGSFNYVKNYSYYCTEQLAARGMALVYTLDLLSEENAAKAKEMIPEILKQLYARQLPDGGFAYWSGQSSANEWASSMAGQFLTEAANKGFKVDGGVISKWKNFQKKCVVNYRKSKDSNLDDLQQAYRLYTLVLAGAADEGAMNRLKASEGLSLQAAWRLAAAYSLRGKKAIAQEMVQGLETSVEKYRDDLTFGSSERDRAMILEALVLTGDITTAVALAQEVADAACDSWSTQGVAFSSVAINRLASKMDTGVLSAEVAGKGVKAAKGLYETSVDPKTGKISVKNTSNGVIYAGLTTTSQAAFDTATEASASGISVSVSFEDTKGAALAPASIQQGKDFYEKITITNNSISGTELTNLALTQMIPSGWEIFNERLYGGSSKNESEYVYKDIRDDRVNWFVNLRAGEKKTFWIRLQATYEGSFILPAASCVDMYDSDIAGNSASSKTTVRR